MHRIREREAGCKTAEYSLAPVVDKPTILVIEDHSALNFLLGIRMRHQGWEVRSAFDGIEGVRMAAREAPDVIVLDIGLPRLRGDQVLRALRAQVVTHDTPVVVVTGYRDAELFDLTASTGVIRHLFYKPTPATKIVAAVRSILEEQR